MCILGLFWGSRFYIRFARSVCLPSVVLCNILLKTDLHSIRNQSVPSVSSLYCQARVFDSTFFILLKSIILLKRKITYFEYNILIGGNYPSGIDWIFKSGRYKTECRQMIVILEAEQVSTFCEEIYFFFLMNHTL